MGVRKGRRGRRDGIGRLRESVATGLITPIRNRQEANGEVVVYRYSYLDFRL